MFRDESLACVVAFWHEEWAEPAYQLYTGLLFGLPLAVTRFVEAAGRRLVWALVSAYFDDSHITDWSSSAGSAQCAYRHLNLLLGTPFSDDKRQHMASTGTFLGLDFDFQSALVQDMVYNVLESRSFKPGVACKLYGMFNFLELGMFGKVGAGGLQAIKDRQLQRGQDLTPALLTSLDVVQSVLASKPMRRHDLWWQSFRRVLAASDAAEDEAKKGSGGFHLVFLDACQDRRVSWQSSMTASMTPFRKATIT